MVVDFGNLPASRLLQNGVSFGLSPRRTGQFVIGGTAEKPDFRVATTGGWERDLFWKEIKLSGGAEDDHGTLGDWHRHGRMVRSPETFPYPNVPIIMLTGHGERSRVVEAIQIGVNEFLLKPVSTKALQSRLISVLTKPRPVVKSGDYYGPVPRTLINNMHEDNDAAITQLVLVN